MIVGVRSWAIGVGLATIVTGFLGAMVGGWKPSPPAPQDPRNCVSTVELITARETARLCRDGARLEVWPAFRDSVLVKCVCPAVTP